MDWSVLLCPGGTWFIWCSLSVAQLSPSRAKKAKQGLVVESAKLECASAMRSAGHHALRSSGCIGGIIAERLPAGLQGSADRHVTGLQLIAHPRFPLLQEQCL